MSQSYWGIVGYGIDLDDIEKYLNHEKINSLVRKLNPKEEFEEDVFGDDTFYGNPYMSFGEFLCELDETNTMTWEDCGDCNKVYFLYEPKYPWLINNNDPTSFKDVEDRIAKVLLEICNASEDYIRSKIFDINDYGCG